MPQNQGCMLTNLYIKFRIILVWTLQVINKKIGKFVNKPKVNDYERERVCCNQGV